MKRTQQIAETNAFSSWDSNDTDVLNRALKLHHNNEIETALSLYLWLTARHPENADLYFNSGMCYWHLGHLSQAVRTLRLALNYSPNLVSAHELLGDVLRAQDRLKEAVESYRRALELEPAEADILHKLASAFKAQGQYDEAIEVIESSLKHKPHLIQAQILLGSLHYEKSEIAQATQIFQNVLALDPNQAQAHFNLSQCLLLLGDFKAGWKEHEWRNQIDALAPLYRKFSAPVWAGESLANKTLLVYAEQGLGDTLQFIRYIPVLKKQGGQILVECQQPLLELLSTIDGIDEIIERDKSLPNFDYHVSLMSLPYLLDREMTNLAMRIPYCFAPTSRRIDLSSFGLTTGRLRIGLCWAGNANHSNDANRSIRFGQFERVINDFKQQIDFVSLQMGGRQKERASYLWGDDIVDVTSCLHNFTDTADVISQLHLIISVDTSVAHLAGAMNCPVWVLLPFVPDSRWLLNRSDTPWYPSMRLIRQSALGDWSSAFTNLHTLLAEWIKANHA